MRLTPTGKVFVRRATLVLGELRRAKDEIEQLQGGIDGILVIGLSIAAHVSLLPRTLQTFQARFPNVHLHLIEGFYPTIESQLHDGSMDFYVGPRPERPIPGDLLQEKLFDNARVVMGRAGHPLQKARSLRDLVDAHWMTASITLKDEAEFGEIFSQHGLAPPKLLLKSQSALTMMITLAYSDILAMVPAQLIEFELTKGALAQIHVKERLPAPPVVLIRRSGLPLTPAAQHFVDLLKRAAPHARARLPKTRS